MTPTQTLPATPQGLALAAHLLRAGQQVAIPTETVYGLAADACNDRAVAGIFAAKNRPAFNPLIVHVSDVATARKIAVMTPEAEALAAQFWPGPLTLVLPIQPDAGLSALVTAGLDSVAVRGARASCCTRIAGAIWWAIGSTLGQPVGADQPNAQ